MKQDRKKTFLALTSALLLTTSCQPARTVEVRPLADTGIAQINPDAGNYYNTGKSYLASGDYGLAIDAFRSSMRSGEDKFAALNGLAVTYDMLGRFDLSQKYYEQALDINPKSPVTYSNLAYSQHLQGENENATKLATMAEKLIDGKGGDKAVKLAKAITGNARLAEQGKEILVTRENMEREKKAVQNELEIERVSEKTWEMVKKEEPADDGLPAYKSNFSVDTIVKKAEGKIAESERLSKNDDTQVAAAGAEKDEVFAHAPVPEIKPDVTAVTDENSKIEQTKADMIAGMIIPGSKPPVPQRLIAVAQRVNEKEPEARVIKASMIVPGTKPVWEKEMARQRETFNDRAETAEQERVYETGAAVVSAPLPSHKPSHAFSYRVLNASSKTSDFLAKRMTAFLYEQGLRVFSYGNADESGRKKTVIKYAPGHQKKAHEIAALLPLPVEMEESGDKDLGADAVLILGDDFLAFDSSFRKKHYNI